MTTIIATASGASQRRVCNAVLWPWVLWPLIMRPCSAGAMLSPEVGSKGSCWHAICARGATPGNEKMSRPILQPRSLNGVTPICSQSKRIRRRIRTATCHKRVVVAPGSTGPRATAYVTGVRVAGATYSRVIRGRNRVLAQR
jgi:hypothetical protein